MYFKTGSVRCRPLSFTSKISARSEIRNENCENELILDSFNGSWKEKWLRSGVADYVIFLITLDDILLWWWLYTANCDQNLCWTRWATSRKPLKIHHRKDGCCKWQIPSAYQEIELSSKMSIHFVEKLNTILTVYPCHIHSLPLSSLQLSKFPSSFWRSVSDFVHMYTEAPNPTRSSTTPSMDNNNYQKNYYIRVMREVSNYLRISLLWQGHIFCLWWNFIYIRCWSETGCCTERGGWRKRNRLIKTPWEIWQLTTEREKRIKKN